MNKRPKYLALYHSYSQRIRFESLTLKFKVKDVEDLDEDWQADVPS